MSRPKLKPEIPEKKAERLDNKELYLQELPTVHQAKQNRTGEIHSSRTSNLFIKEHGTEQYLSDLVARLQENGYTQNQWENMDKAERGKSLQDAVVLMYKELSSSVELPDKLQICYTDQPHLENGAQFLALESSLLELADASQVYSNIYNTLRKKLKTGEERLLSARSKAYAAAEEAYELLEMDMFVTAYQKATDISGGLGASQGLAIMARANLNEAARLSATARSLSNEASHTKSSGRRAILQSEANQAMARSRELAQSGRRLATQYNNAVKNAQKKKPK